MKLAPIPTDEISRMADLKALKILDTPREPRFDLITDLLVQIFDVPLAFFTLIDSDRQWFKSTCGLSGVDSTPREIGFCAHAITESGPMIVPDATKDSRFADNPFVTGDFHLRFYAGVQIHGPQGKPVGTLCVVDTKPRELTDKQLSILNKFGALVEAEIQRI